MGKKKGEENPKPEEPKEGCNLLGKPRFKKLENGRFKCVETGHELPAHAREAYTVSKHCRLGLIDAALARSKPPLNMFRQDLLSSRKITASGGYSTSSGPMPVDLNAESEASSGTPTSTFRRPTGSKAAKARAKGKRKGKGEATGSAAHAPVSGDAFAAFGKSYDMRLLLDATVALNSTSDPSTRQMYEERIQMLKSKLGYS
ncbi:surfeit locus protein 2-like [Salvia divinorum]|uniref:Surfeit locus protein 2-like n=1 Tax=Salvia divinorum TaxID=28513 RepID=A0ABD1I6B2_SALDI